MQLHRWSQEDIAFLRESVERYGWTVGCKTTAEELGVTYSSCSNMCHKQKFTSTSTQPLRSRVFEDRKKRHVVTNEEEVQIANYLNREISKNPHNLQKVFRECAAKFDMSVSSIRNRWYGIKTGKTDYSKRPSCRKNIGITYAVVGDSTVINGKNQNTPTKKKTHWVLAMLKKMLNK